MTAGDPKMFDGREVFTHQFSAASMRLFRFGQYRTSYFVERPHHRQGMEQPGGPMPLIFERMFGSETTGHGYTDRTVVSAVAGSHPRGLVSRIIGLEYAMHSSLQAAAYHEAGHVVAQVVTYRTVLFPRPKPSPLILFVEIV
jgi:hypothetical protein